MPLIPHCRKCRKADTHPSGGTFRNGFCAVCRRQISIVVFSPCKEPTAFAAGSVRKVAVMAMRLESCELIHHEDDNRGEDWRKEQPPAFTSVKKAAEPKTNYATINEMRLADLYQQFDADDDNS